MTEVELQRMVVKLVGDNAQFTKSMTESAKHVADIVPKIQQASAQIEGISSSLKGFASAAVSALGSFGLASSLQGAFRAYSDFEDKAVKFNAVLEFNGRNVKEVTAEYQKFAKQMIENTTASKGEIFQLLKTAETMGFTGQKAEQLATAAIGLGAASDMDANSAMRMVIALERGNVQMLRRIPALRGIHDQGQLVAKAQELMAMGLKQEQAMTETASFKIEKLGRTFKGLSMEIGGMLATGLGPLLDIAGQSVGMFNALDATTKQYTAVVVMATLAFLGLPSAISTVMFLMDALGITFVVNLGIQAVQLAIAGVAWLAWTAAVYMASTAMVLVNAVVWAFQVGLAALNFVFMALGGNVALSLLSLVSWKTVLAIATAVEWAYITAKVLLNSLLFGNIAAYIGLIPALMSYIAGMFTAKGATWLLNVALTAKNILLAGIPLVIGAVVVALIAFVGAVLLSVAAVLALVAGLTIASGLLVIVSGAVAGIVAVLSGAAFVIATVALGLWDITKALKEIQVGSGGVAQLKIAFWEWFGIIKDIVRAAQVDLPLAWELSKAAFWLLVAQVKTAWPPLWAYVLSTAKTVGLYLWDSFSDVFNGVWTYIKDGFSASWEFISTGFTILWTLIKELASPTLKLLPWIMVWAQIEAFQAMLSLQTSMWRLIMDGWSGVAAFSKAALDPKNWISGKRPDPKAFLPDPAALRDGFKQVQDATSGILDPRKQIDAQKAALDKAQAGLKDAADKVKVATPDIAGDLAKRLEEAQKRMRDAQLGLAGADLLNSPEVAAAKAEVQRIRDLIGKKEAEKAAARAKTAGIGIGDGFNQGMKSELAKTEGVLRFGAEAISHILDYQQKLRGINAPSGTGAGGAVGAPGVNVAPAPAGAPAPPAPADNPLVQQQVRTNVLIARTNELLEALARKQGVAIPVANIGGA